MPLRQQVEGKMGHVDRGAHEGARLAGRGRQDPALAAANAKGLPLFVSDRELAYRLGIMRWGEGGGGTATARRRAKEAKGHRSRGGRGAPTWNR